MGYREKDLNPRSPTSETGLTRLPRLTTTAFPFGRKGPTRSRRDRRFEPLSLRHRRCLRGGFRSCPVSYRPARHGSLALEDGSGMNEISFAAPEIAASRQRGMPADEGELWQTLRLDAERAAAGEEMLRGFLDLVVLRHDRFASGLSLLLALKLAEYSIPAERLGEIARAAMVSD